MSRDSQNDNLEALRLPKVEIHTTDLCNNRCTFCTTGWQNLDEHGAIQHPPRERVRQQLEAAYARGARRVLFQGGEPTLRRDLAELVLDARELGFEVSSIFTNARVAASERGAQWLVSMGVSWFQVSVQGGTAAAHDASVAAKGAFAQTVEGTRQLIARGQRVKINSVLTRHLLDSLEAYASLMIELEPEEVGFDTIKPSGAFAPERESFLNLAPKLSDYSAALLRSLERMDEAGICARLTSFPACLIPGGERFVSEESATTLVEHHDGQIDGKRDWKRGLQRKASDCEACAYDPVCGGLYAPYAELHGLSELKALSHRRAPPSNGGSAAGPDNALTRALRALLLGDEGRALGVTRVSASQSGGQVLLCEDARGRLALHLEPKHGGRAYAITERFEISYRPAEEGTPPTPKVGRTDFSAVDRLVELLRANEHELP